MLIPKFNEPKPPKYDDKAAREIFGCKHDPEDKGVLAIPSDTSNPIDTRLRQLAFNPYGTVNLKEEFYGKWVVIMVGDGFKVLKMVKGRIKDIYLSRDIRIETRKKEIYIVPFGKVMEVSEREP